VNVNDTNELLERRKNMRHEGLQFRRSLQWFVGAVALAIGAYLTSSIEHPPTSSVPVEHDGTSGAKHDSQTPAKLTDIFDDIEGRPLGHQAAAADHYKGVTIIGEQIAFVELAEDPRTDVLWATLTPDMKYDGHAPPKRTVRAAIGRGVYPDLATVRPGQRLWVSGKIQEAQSGQIQLGLVTLAFPREPDRDSGTVDQAAPGGTQPIH
jgi:hypothetical protein